MRDPRVSKPMTNAVVPTDRAQPRAAVSRGGVDVGGTVREPQARIRGNERKGDEIAQAW
ncbi:hypothetical protein [Lysobacter capsici]|uniref:hypothetical protein n=1 Tax=Lysobacter capsici TaxID=435897 RepID=UPI001C0018D5|nr:hypothetical protein [Lysobacter capsici]QWF15084.1 hypothetical protein KME82_14875 [Lysobacter capsici]